ncbi:MAG: hypothetical protein KCHDKBKB_00656 [Elusimicrobia bacterium]|nr:hypothetical protein [Elusimicrobiota bacterium]
MSKFLGWCYLTYSWKYYILRPWEFVRDLYKDLRAIIQRGIRGWADCDTWSLDYHLSLWMPDALRFLKENKHGIPCEFAGKTAKDFKKGVKDWDKTMDKMIRGFEISYELGEMYPKLPENFDSLSEKEKHDFWIKHHKEMDKLQKIEQEGLQLFAKYFDNLWD